MRYPSEINPILPVSPETHTCAGQESWRILGLDLSLGGRSGYTLINGQGALLRGGAVQVPRDLKDMGYRQRMHGVAAQFLPLCEQTQPTHVAVEDPIVHGTNSGSLTLAKLNGCVGFALALQLPKLIFCDYGVSEWRKAMEFFFKSVKGESKKDKTERLKMALVLFAGRVWPDAEFSSVDNAESALIALRCLRHLTGSAPLPEKKARVMKGEKGVKRSSGSKREKVGRQVLIGYDTPQGGQ